MSNQQDHMKADAECTENPCGSIALLIHPREKKLGDLDVRRILPFRRQRSVGPWVFFDHMGPASFAKAKGIDIGPHPHINLATLTYLFEGSILHRDSLGTEQLISPGAVNLMVAGRGITHSEREPAEVRQSPHTLHGLQLWLALPEEKEEMEPAFFHYRRDEIPRGLDTEVMTEVVMGDAYGVKSPVKTFAPTLCVVAQPKAGQSLEIPHAEEQAMYVAGGAVLVDGVKIDTHHMAVIDPEAHATVEALDDSRLLIVGGAKIGHRFMDWNFISSRKERVEQAKADWREGRFPDVPGDDGESIPLPGDS